MSRFFALAVVFLTLVAPSTHAQSVLQRVQVIALPGVEGRIDHLAVDLAAKRLYVAALGNNSLEVVDLDGGKRVQSIGGLKEPQGVGVVQKTGKIVVASGEDGKCRIFHRSLKLLATIDELDDADNVQVDLNRDLAYVGFGRGALAVIDTEKLSRVGTIKLDAHPESFQLQSAGTRIFVNVPEARHIAVIDGQKREVLSTWTLKEATRNFPMALDEPNHRLFVACRKPARLLVFDTETGRRVASLDCCGDADDVFCDLLNRRVYVSGGDGTISVFSRRSADDYILTETVKSAPGARTSLLVGALNKLLLAVPHCGDSQQAGIWVYSVAGS
jgi:DNA-binding beta-propeller fold protein YncE